MKAHETTVQLYSRMGHAFAPDTFPSKRQALEHARWMVNNDYAWTYRIIKEKKG